MSVTLVPKDSKELTTIKRYVTVEETIPPKKQKFKKIAASFSYYKSEGNNIRVPMFMGLQLHKKAGYTIVENKDYPSISGKVLIPLRPEQELARQEVVTRLVNNRAAVLQMYCGAGKSLTSIAIALSPEISKKICVVAPKVFLAEQWCLSMKQKTNCKVSSVAANGKADYSSDIICTYVGRIHKIPEDIRKQFGTLILDELPYLNTDTYAPPILLLQPQYIIGCTARLFRENGMHKLGEYLCSTYKYELNSYKPLTVRKLAVDIMPRTEYNEGTEDKNFILTHATLYEDPEYLLLLLDIVLSLREEGHKPLIMFHAKESLATVYNYLLKNNIGATYFYEDMVTYNDGDVLLSTYSKLMYGFDEESVATNWTGKRISAFVVTDSLDALTAIEQSIGRVVRANYPIVVPIINKARYSVKHYKSLCNWCEEIRSDGSKREVTYEEYSLT